MIYPSEQKKAASYWDGLTSKEDLIKVFSEKEKIAAPEMGLITGGMGADPDLPGYYTDEEFKEVAAKLKPLAEKMLPILEDVLKHIPYPCDRKTFENKANGIIGTFINQLNVPQGVAAYTIFLIVVLQDDYIKRIERGFTIPEIRAEMRAYNRYKAIKEEAYSRRAEFEKTEEYRLQKIELKLHLRDHIEYPE